MLSNWFLFYTFVTYLKHFDKSKGYNTVKIKHEGVIMKKQILTLLVCFAVVSSLPFSFLSASADMPTPEKLNGYENVCLTYTFDYYGYNYGRHNAEDLRPYVAYYDEEGNAVDYFFDSYLFLPCNSIGPSGAPMHASSERPTVATDWIAYVDDTFAKGYNVDALEIAFGNAKKALNDSTHKKAGVFFSILYPTKTSVSFGELGGRSLDLSVHEDRKYAIKWIIDEQVKRFNENEYKNTKLIGFYWLEEYLMNCEFTDEDIQLFNFASDYLHSLGLKFIWIPWYKAYGTSQWSELGFDVACMQPNMYFMNNADYERIKKSLEFSDKFGLSMEVEIDLRALGVEEYFNRYLQYLEDGMNLGAMDSVKMYYQDKKTAIYYTAATDKSKKYGRLVYDLTYKYAKGTLAQADIDIVRGRGDLYLGDINGSGSVDKYDYILCKRICMNTYKPDSLAAVRADVNQNGTIEKYDYILIKRHVMGTYKIA